MACSTRTELLAGLVLATLGASASFAQSAEPDPELAARAEALEGRKAFEAGEFELAIIHYEAARELKAAPGLLFNLAQSHRRAGNLERAAFFFRGYLETNPPADQARIVEAALLQLGTDQLLAIDTERLEVEKTRLAVAQRALVLALTAPLPPPPPPVTSRWWFWTIVGAATVGTAVAVSVAASPHAAPTTFSPINAR